MNAFATASPYPTKYLFVYMSESNLFCSCQFDEGQLPTSLLPQFAHCRPMEPHTPTCISSIPSRIHTRTRPRHLNRWGVNLIYVSWDLAPGESARKLHARRAVRQPGIRRNEMGRETRRIVLNTTMRHWSEAPYSKKCKLFFAGRMTHLHDAATPHRVYKIPEEEIWTAV